MIALIDYQMGNLASVGKALAAVGGAYRLVTRPEEAEGCSGVLLPGVGNFGDGMRNLAGAGWPDWLRRYCAGGTRPFLGICLGMQMLFDASEEAPGVPGLGIVPGKVVRFPEGRGKVPQIGWNAMRKRQDLPIFRDLAEEEYFYFVHSFFVVPQDPQWIAGTTEYILPFACAVGRGCVAATQFHPEKSQQAGLDLLRAFVRLAEAAGPAAAVGTP